MTGRAWHFPDLSPCHHRGRSCGLALGPSDAARLWYIWRGFDRALQRAAAQAIRDTLTEAGAAQAPPPEPVVRHGLTLAARLRWHAAGEPDRGVRGLVYALSAAAALMRFRREHLRCAGFRKLHAPEVTAFWCPVHRTGVAV